MDFDRRDFLKVAALGSLSYSGCIEISEEDEDDCDICIVTGRKRDTSEFEEEETAEVETPFEGETEIPTPTETEEFTEIETDTPYEEPVDTPGFCPQGSELDASINLHRGENVRFFDPSKYGRGNEGFLRYTGDEVLGEYAGGNIGLDLYGTESQVLIGKTHNGRDIYRYFELQKGIDPNYHEDADMVTVETGIGIDRIGFNEEEIAGVCVYQNG